MTVMTFFAFVSAIPFTIWEWLDGALVAPDVTGVMVVLYTALLPSLVALVLVLGGIGIAEISGRKHAAA